MSLEWKIQKMDLMLQELSRRIAQQSRVFASLNGVLEKHREAKTLGEIEREAIVIELRKHGWNKKASAKVLKVAKSTLHEKIKRHGITEDEK